MADDDAGLGGIDRNGDFVAGALNVDMRNARRVELFLEHFAQVEVFHQIVGKILLARIPFGAPVQNHAHTGAMGINFLTHFLSSYFWSSTTVIWLVRL